MLAARSPSLLLLVGVLATLLASALGQTTLSSSTTVPSFAIIPLNITSSLLPSAATLSIATASATIHICTLAVGANPVQLKIINFSPDQHSIALTLALEANSTLGLDSLVTIGSASQPQWFTGVLTKKVTSGYMYPRPHTGCPSTCSVSRAPK